ncbi:YfcC family protein [Shouchella clausii]|uniref:C4-dicarboxylate ABC transporter permease n=1 Tax=Shouchella clausii TaxID=79880 RepID=A0A268S596_SHOCL|nr:Na+/H+ antiporter NhaC family protein [Shouchella clausii]PAD43667.1 C4-dicarboxylate ABC transporter permease [Bacillus sp. 7520-S]PAD92072.1 C4-dicarboxylate ABC transporter permease [Shouchella clausii]PAE97138.1 C4-dicarboxylate ABC transporter permease [Shouchella clausii]PAF27567.1 C4-dicarboxylate ABC transporter permease [Shouchella clausii]
MEQKDTRNSEKTAPISKVPHTYAILFAMIVLAALATYFVSPGAFERVEQDGRTLLVEDSYTPLEASPVTPFEMFQAIPTGLMDSAQIVFYIFLVGGTFGVILKTGTIDATVYSLIGRLQSKGIYLIPAMMIVFSIPGATIGMSEEIIIFVPIGIAVAKALGYDTITGTAMVSLGAMAGFVGGMMNPFTVGVAQSIAELPLFSGIAFRFAVFLLFLGSAIWLVVRYALKVTKDPSASLMHGFESGKQASAQAAPRFSGRHACVLAIIAVGFALNMYGVFQWDWYLTEMAAIFIIIGFLVGLTGGLGVNGMFTAFTDGMKMVTFGALVVGFARAILVVMEQGQIMDTLVYQLSNWISVIPSQLTVIGMFILQLIINFFIPSGSGQAAVTMPLMTPLADMLDIQRQAAVLAFQYGDGIMNTINPTSAPLMAFLAIAGIPYLRWVKFIWKLVVIWFAISAIALLVAVALNIS